MNEQFQRELNNAISRVQDAITPYTRFVRSEQSKTFAMQQFANMSTEMTTLKGTIEKVHL